MFPKSCWLYLPYFKNCFEIIFSFQESAWSFLHRVCLRSSHFCLRRCYFIGTKIKVLIDCIDAIIHKYLGRFIYSDKKSLVHTSCECECKANFDITCLFFAANVLLQLLQITCCEKVLTKIASLSHSQEVAGPCLNVWYKHCVKCLNMAGGNLVNRGLYKL